MFGFKQTILCPFYGSVFSILFFLTAHTLFGFKWIPEYTFNGLVLWILLVTIPTIFAQTFLFVGILFNSYSNRENDILLHARFVSVSGFQLSTSASLPWTVAKIIGSVAKTMVTWKTRNIYGAALMGTTSNLVDNLCSNLIVCMQNRGRNIARVIYYHLAIICIQ